MFENRVKQRLADGGAAWGAHMLDASELGAKFTVDCDIDFLWDRPGTSPARYTRNPLASDYLPSGRLCLNGAGSGTGSDLD